MPQSTLNSLRGCWRSAAIAAQGSVSLEADGRYLCCSVQFSAVTQSCLTLCDPMDCSTPGLPVRHQLPELTQTHVRHVGDTIQPSHPLSPHSPPAFNLSWHQGLFQWVSSSHQVAKLLEFQFQHQPSYYHLKLMKVVKASIWPIISSNPSEGTHTHTHAHTQSW